MTQANGARRERRTQAQMAEFREAVFEIVAENQPCSARQVYYRAVVAGIIDKDTAGSRSSEKKIGRVLDEMREGSLQYREGSGYYRWFTRVWAAAREQFPDDDTETIVYRTLGDAMPFSWITDNTRTRYQADVHSDKDAAQQDWFQSYRRDLWRAQPTRVEVWCESDSIAGVIMDLCYSEGIALLPCRGQAPKRFVFDSAEDYAVTDKPVTVLYVGDFDPSGLDIGNSVEDRLDRYLPPDSDVDIDFRRIAVTAQQVLDDSLPGHGLNANLPAPVRDRFLDECAAYGIPGEAVEAEALRPADLRTLVSQSINGLKDQRLWSLEEAVEAQERRDLFAMLDDE